ncbi:DUF4145 domain-containing protein [Enterobacter hormaechei]
MLKSITDTFTLEDNPCWECPTCHQQTLTIIKEALYERPDSSSGKRIAYDHSKGRESHPYELTGGVFTAMLRCVSPSCNESVACSGTLSYDVDYNEDWSSNLNERHVIRYNPKMFVPPLHPFLIPDECDIRIINPLMSSFSLLPSSPSSAANNLRIAVERFMDVLGVSNKEKLHQRIELLEQTDPSKAHLIMSIKWLGNSGSHEYETVNTGDVITGYTVFKHLLDKLYPAKLVDNSEALADELHLKFDAKYAKRCKKG